MLHPESVKYSGIEMKLIEVFSGNEYRTVSDGNGYFIIHPLKDGVYLMKIAGGMPSVDGTGDETTYVVDITKKASRASLPLQLKDTGCYRREFQLADVQYGMPMTFANPE